jgi:hypothetical protein
MTRREVQELLAICEAADDQDTGSLDAFREAATVGVVAELCKSWLARRDGRVSRNIVAPETAERNRNEGDGYTFHAPLADDFEGVAFTVAALRIGDHAHLDCESGRAVNSRQSSSPRVTRGGAGRLVLRWHEWEVLREIFAKADCIHVAEVERPTVGQMKYHTAGKTA